MADTSIPALKRAFLASQVRVLSAPLEPTENWRERSGGASEDGDLDERVVDGVLAKVNATLKQHNNAAFPTPALAHVASQIDALYWQSSEPSIGEEGLQDGQIDRSADLTSDEVIASLPTEWPDEVDQPLTSSPANASAANKRGAAASNRKSTASRTSGLESFAEGARYKKLRAKLVGLQEERARAAKRVQQAEQLRTMLKPMEDPATYVQENLVTRDGELGKELERLVVLSARVGGKLGEAKSAR